MRGPAPPAPNVERSLVRDARNCESTGFFTRFVGLKLLLN